MNRVLIIGIIFSFFSCDRKNNCDVIRIDETVDSLEHTFTSPIRNTFKMDCEIRWKFNDTVIINGLYYGPMDTVINFPPTDYYNGKTGIDFRYKRYKATKVEIQYTYCFY